MKEIPQILASLALIILFATGFVSCGPQGSTDATASVAPLTPADMEINNYERLANELVRVGKRHKDGDVSVTMRLIELRHDFRDSGVRLQAQSATLTPPQQQRIAAIVANADPYLQH